MAQSILKLVVCTGACEPVRRSCVGIRSVGCVALPLGGGDPEGQKVEMFPVGLPDSRRTLIDETGMRMGLRRDLGREQEKSRVPFHGHHHPVPES